MAESHIASEHEFQEIVPVSGPPASNLQLDDLKRVKLIVSADLGSCKMYVRDVLELQRGSVVQLDKLAGEMTDIYVNGQALARGEVVVIGDTLHVRIGEIMGQEHKGEFDVQE